MKIGRIKKLINEEIGVSNFAVDALDILEKEGLDIDFEKETGKQIMVSDSLIKLGEEFFDLDLYVLFVKEEPKTYPVYNAKIELDYDDNIIEILLYLHESFKYNNTTKDIFNNKIIKSSLIHELHHLIRNYNMRMQKDFKLRFEKTNPFLCYLFDIYEVKHKDGRKKISVRAGEWGYPSEELTDLYYYLSKSELGSVVPEFKYYNNKNLINAFRKLEGMSYSEFSNYIQDKHNGRTPTNKEYNNVKKRVRYFFNKIRKLGVSE